MENYFKEQIKLGYIAEDGEPLKCDKCECTDFIYYNHDFLDYIGSVGINVLEYMVKCSKCNKDVGYWSYGHWQI